jgi:hypothetical protein
MKTQEFPTKEQRPYTQQGLCLGQPPNGWLIYAVRFIAGQCGSAIGNDFCNMMDIVNWASPSWQPGQQLDLSLQYYALPNGWKELNRYHLGNGCDNVDPLVPNRVIIQKIS